MLCCGSIARALNLYCHECCKREMNALLILSCAKMQHYAQHLGSLTSQGDTRYQNSNLEKIRLFSKIGSEAAYKECHRNMQTLVHKNNGFPEW